MSIEQEGLFPEPERAPVRPVTLAEQARLARTTITSYQAKDPVRCDHCMQSLAVNKLAPVARKARHRVKYGTGNLVEFVCDPHRQLVADQIAKAKHAAEVAAHTGRHQ